MSLYLVSVTVAMGIPLWKIGVSFVTPSTARRRASASSSSVASISASRKAAAKPSSISCQR